MARIAVVSNYAWTLFNFRRDLMAALVAAGHDMHAISEPDEYSDRLGVPFHAIDLDRAGMNPCRDIAAIFRLRGLFRRLDIDVALTFTIKPNIYGTIAAGSLGIPVLNNVSGLGTAFIRTTWLTRIVKLLYRLAFRHSTTVFFQNSDDRDLFLGQGLLPAEKAGLLPGSGIDLDRYRPRPKLEADPRSPVFLLIARLLWDKGVREFADASAIVRTQYPNARFQLLGFLDVANRTAIPRETVEGWVRDGSVEYLGTVEDVRPVIAAADCVVLPSYREGTPRTLLEAAAMAKPLIATAVPGCREVVDDGKNGFLCRVRDAADLAEKLLKFCALAAIKREMMGQASREKVEREFDQQIVIRKYLSAIARLA